MPNAADRDAAYPIMSVPSMLVYLAAIAALVTMAVGKVGEPAAWTILGSIMSGLFGVSMGKTIERVRGSGSGGGGAGGDSGASDPRVQAVRPPVTPERPAASFPRRAMALLRRDHSLAFATVLTVLFFAAFALAR